MSNAYSNRADSGRLAPPRNPYSSRDDRRRDRDRDGGDRGDRRRRSRSPQGHGRRDRRDYGELNSYSSSRDYREREREDRHGGHGGHGGRGDRRDRDWDRDRGSARRDARRDDGDRRRDNRRDGDLFDDRRRPRDDRDRRDNDRDRARDRDDMRQMERQNRQKSVSPPRRPKEPTPDLTDVVSVKERKRINNQWDKKPPGYDHLTAEQAKLSGMFPLPGAPRQQPIDPSKLQAMTQSGGQASSSALKPETSRQSRRLFVYNVPASATNESLCDFFNLQMNGLNVTRGQDPCISAHLSPNKSYALLEFKTTEDTTNAAAFDGISMEPDSMDTSENGANGTAQGLLLKRPKDYIMPTITDETQNPAGVLSNSVPDTQHKISVTNISPQFGEEQVQELLSAFGELKNFVLVKDVSNGQSRGIAFAEYVDAAMATDEAVQNLNGMDLTADCRIKAQRASIGIQQVGGEMSVNAMSMIAATNDPDASLERCICFSNMFSDEAIMDKDEVEEILEDLEEQCVKFGKVLEIKMPRPSGGSKQVEGLKNIYVKFEKPEAAESARVKLGGCKFSGRTVIAIRYSEESFDVDAF